MAGEITNNSKLEAKGKAENIAGQAQEKIGIRPRYVTCHKGERPICCRPSVYNTMVNGAAFDPWEKGGDG